MVMIQDTVNTITVVLFGPNDHILLMQRNPLAYPDTTYTDPFPYFWELVGGHIDRGETSVEAVLREVWEETGIVLSADDCTLIETFPFFSREVPASNHLYAVRLRSDDLPAIRCSQEHVAFSWVPLSEALHRRLAFQHSHLLARFAQSRWEVQ